MTIISILIGLALEYFVGSLDRIRNFSWFDNYSQWLELQLGKYGFWSGPVGLLITLAIPLLLLLAIAGWAMHVSIIFSFILATFIFIYSLGPEINGLLNSYLDALETKDVAKIKNMEQLFTGNKDDETRDEAVFIQGIFTKANEHIFGVIFWFIVLGMVGALLYSLTIRMKGKFADIHGGYADAVRNLHKILTWPSARLLALGFALAGSLVDALEAWRDVQGHTLDCSEEVIGQSGLGGIQYESVDSSDEDEMQSIYAANIQDVQALINRALIVWLTIAGVLTLGGWLH